MKLTTRITQYNSSVENQTLSTTTKKIEIEKLMPYCYKLVKRKSFSAVAGEK